MTKISPFRLSLLLRAKRNGGLRTYNMQETNEAEWLVSKGFLVTGEDTKGFDYYITEAGFSEVKRWITIT